MLRTLAGILILLTVISCGKGRKPAAVHTENPLQGEILFKASGCAACHSVTGQNLYGPPLNSILGKKVLVIRGETTDSVIVDRDYIMRSLKDPGFEKVAGFQKRKMPVINLSQEDIDCLVDYIISINKNSTGQEENK